MMDLPASSKQKSIASHGASAAAMSPNSLTSTFWDPEKSKDWDIQTPTPQCIERVKRDIMAFYNDPPPGIFLVPDDKNLTLVHALVMGPYETPYEGGFFYFLLRCPPSYPIHPPRVKLMTTGGDTVRFNPNLYRDGKVCLSILGTWTGPSWSPAQSLSSVLMSIQSLMNEKPYHNEPGFETEHRPGDAERYNEIIAHETIRVAVCELLEQLILPVEQRAKYAPPEPLGNVAGKSLPQFYENFIQVCERYAASDGTTMLDPFGEQRGRFEWGKLKERLAILKVRFKEEREDLDVNETDSAELSPIDATDAT